MLVAARDGFGQRVVQLLQVARQQRVGFAKRLHGLAERVAQAGDFGGPGADVRGGLGQAGAVGFQALGKARGGALQHFGRAAHQLVDGLALLGGRVVDALQQRAQRVQHAGAFVQHGVVARHAVGELVAQLANHLGGGARRGGGGVQQAVDFAQRAGRLRGRLAGHGLGGIGQRGQHGLLLARAVGAALLPLLVQLRGHVGQRLLPGGQADLLLF